MAVAALDPNRAADALVAAGFDDAQTKAIISVAAIAHGDLATKADLNTLRVEAKANTDTLLAALDKLRTEHRTDMDKLQTEHHTDMELLRTEHRANMSSMKYQILTAVVSAAGLVIAAQAFLQGGAPS